MDLPEAVLQSISSIIQDLPVLSKYDIADPDDSCPICLMPFSAILDCSSEDPDYGITKLISCNHLFCRKDLTHWIRSLHGSCPTCRHTFLDIQLPSEFDNESSDGGEYIPSEHDEDFDDDDEHAFLDTDGFEADYDVEWEQYDHYDVPEGEVWFYDDTSEGWIPEFDEYGEIPLPPEFVDEELPFPPEPFEEL